MGTFPEIIEEIIRADNSGIFTDEQKEDNLYMESVVNQYRAQAIFDVYKKTRRINSSWTQKCLINIDKEIQESTCYVLFPAPQPITLDSFLDGHFYVGSACGLINFPKARSRADLTNRQNHRHTKIKSNTAKVVWADVGYEVYGNMGLESLLVDGVHAIPTDVPTYNKWIDRYPISPDVLVLMKSYVIKELIQSTNTPTDTKSDSQHTTTSINAQK